MSEKKEMSLFPKEGECVVSKFLKKEVRRAKYNSEWWFSVVDVIESLTESVNPSDYWYQLKKKMKTEETSEVSTIYRKLKLPAKDGKNKFLKEKS